MLKQVGCDPTHIRGIGISMTKLGRYYTMYPFESSLQDWIEFQSLTERYSDPRNKKLNILFNANYFIKKVVIIFRS